MKDLAALRRSIAPLGAEYPITRTPGRLAAEQRPDGFVNLVAGPTALTFVQGDAAAVAKALREFARANPLLVIKGGLLGDSVLGAQAAAALADLPPREVLLARLAGALAAPMQSFAGLLAAVPRNFAYGLAALRDERAAGAPIPEVPSAASATEAAPAAEEPVPVAEAPAADAPAAEAPAAEAPAAEAPATEAPAAEAPATEPASAEATPTEADATPAAEEPDAERPETDS